MLSKLTRAQQRTLFASNLPKNFSFNGSQNVIFTYVGVCKYILKEHIQDFPHHFHEQMIENIEAIEIRYSSIEKNVTRQDLWMLICGPGFRQFWMRNFSFGQFFNVLHFLVEINSNSKRLYYQYKTLTLWYFIETYSFIQGRLVYHPIPKDMAVLKKKQQTKIDKEIANPRIKFMIYEELRSKDKQIEFCFHFLDRLNTYDIREESQRKNNNLPNLPIYKRKIEVFLRQIMKPNRQIRQRDMNEETAENKAAKEIDQSMMKQQVESETRNRQQLLELDMDVEMDMDIEMDQEQELYMDLKLDMKQYIRQEAILELDFVNVEEFHLRSLDAVNLFDSLLDEKMEIENNKSTISEELLTMRLRSQESLIEVEGDNFQGKEFQRDFIDENTTELSSSSPILGELDQYNLFRLWEQSTHGLQYFI